MPKREFITGNSFCWCCLVFLFLSLLFTPALGISQNKVLERSVKQEISNGKYQGQDWYIDRDHILWWNKKQYIPFGLNEIKLKKEIKQILKDIDLMIESGITDIYAIGYNPDIPVGKRHEYDNKLKTIIDYLEKKKINYIFYYTPAFIINELKGDRTTRFLLNTKVINAVTEDIRRFAPIISKPGLRAVLFMEEINGNEGIEDNNENLYRDLPLLLNIYGEKIKKEIGNIPVIINIASDLNFLPFIWGLQTGAIDGIIVQIHGAVPKDVEFKANRTLSVFLSALNALPKTKLLWGYSQAMIMEDFVLFRSPTLMREHFLSLSKHGITGILMDQVSSFGFIKLGLPEDSEELRQLNVKWFGENKEYVVNDILMRAQRHEFSSTEKHAVADLSGERPQMSQSQVLQVAKKHFITQKQFVKNKDLQIHNPFFKQEERYWTVGLGDREDYIWFVKIDDSSGKIIFDGMNLLEETRSYNYPTPSDEEILLKRNKFLIRKSPIETNNSLEQNEIAIINTVKADPLYQNFLKNHPHLRLNARYRAGQWIVEIIEVKREAGYYTIDPNTMQILDRKLSN